MDHHRGGLGGSRSGAATDEDGILDEPIVGRVASVAADRPIVRVAISTRQRASSGVVRVADGKAHGLIVSGERRPTLDRHSYELKTETRRSRTSR